MKYTETRGDTQRHTETHTETHTEKHSETHTETHTEKHSETHTETHSETHTETHTGDASWPLRPEYWQGLDPQRQGHRDWREHVGSEVKSCEAISVQTCQQCDIVLEPGVCFTALSADIKDTFLLLLVGNHQRRATVTCTRCSCIPIEELMFVHGSVLGSGFFVGTFLPMGGGFCV